MEILTKKSVKELIQNAVSAGCKKPSTTQLITLAQAVSDKKSYLFLKNASVKDLTAVKNYIATLFMQHGEAPKDMASEGGNMFGMPEDKSKISSDAQNKIYDVEPVEKTTKEQKDIAERNLNEDKHPETSDRKEKMPTVDPPQKEKSDFKKVIEQASNDKNSLSKASNIKFKIAEKVFDVISEFMDENEEREDIKTDRKDIRDDKKDIIPDVKDDKKEDGKDGRGVDTVPEALKLLEEFDRSGKIPDKYIDEHAERVEKGEDPKKVMTEFFEDLSEVKKKKDKSKDKEPEKKDKDKEPEKKEFEKIDKDKEPEKKEPEKIEKKEGSYIKLSQENVQQGDILQVEMPMTGLTNVTIDSVAQTPEGTPSYVVTDPAGTKVVLPGEMEVSKVEDIQTANKK